MLWKGPLPKLIRGLAFQGHTHLHCNLFLRLSLGHRQVYSGIFVSFQWQDLWASYQSGFFSASQSQRSILLLLSFHFGLPVNKCALFTTIALITPINWFRVQCLAIVSLDSGPKLPDLNRIELTRLASDHRPLFEPPVLRDVCLTMRFGSFVLYRPKAKQLCLR